MVSHPLLLSVDMGYTFFHVAKYYHGIESPQPAAACPVDGCSQALLVASSANYAAPEPFPSELLIGPHIAQIKITSLPRQRKIESGQIVVSALYY